MVRRRLDLCDEGRLRRFFEEGPDGNDRAEVLEHLDDCPSCQRRLDEFATECPWWGDVRRFAPGSGWAAPTAPRAAATEAVEFLDPPSVAGDLGQFGPYRVGQVIGRGGMGVVLGAFDPALNRRVAIKVMAPQLAAVASARRRFEREARAAASICHEHVVSIHAVDEAKGLPYLVMPFIPGRSLQERIDQSGPMDLEPILRIGMQVASGLAAAHAQGLIHRDIKPSNILLENGVERVKITDFGLARMADDASVTESGVLAGTPQYMAPEQARGEAVDHRADLFSLGSVMYAMATGRSPFRAATTMGVLRRVCEDEPRPIRESNPAIPAWLDAIIMRLLAKDPARRHESAEEVMTLLGGCLAHLQQPRHRPLPAGLEGRSIGGRNRRRIGVLAGLLALAGVLALAGIWTVRVETPEGTLVIESEDPAVRVTVDGRDVEIDGAGPSTVRLRVGPHQVKATSSGMPVLEEVVSIKRDGREVVRVRREPKAERVVAGGEAKSKNLSPPVAKAEAPSGRDVPSATATATPAASPPVAKAELSGGSLIRSLTDLGAGVTAAAFSPDGKTLIWGGKAPRLMSLALPDGASASIESIPAWSEAIAFAPDGKSLAVGDTAGRVQIRDASGRAVLRTIEVSKDFQVFSVAFSPDSKTLATGSRDGSIRLWDVATGAMRFAPPGLEVPVGREIPPILAPPPSLPDQNLPVGHVRFTPDGKTLVAATGDWDRPSVPGRLIFWRMAENAVESRAEPTGRISGLAISPDSKTIATGSRDGIRLWEIGTQEPVASLNTDDWQVNALAFSPDGKTLASGQNRGQVTLWDVASRRVRGVLGARESKILAVAFAPDGRSLAAGGLDGKLELWALPEPRPASTDRPVADARPVVVASPVVETTTEAAPLASRLAKEPMIRPFGTFRFRLFLLDLDSGKASPVVDEPGQGYTYCGSPCWSSDGKRLLFDATPQTSWDLSHLFEIDLAARGPARDLGMGNCPSFSPDGRRIVFLSNAKDRPRGIFVMDADGSGLTHFDSYGRPKWSPDGREVLLSGFNDPPTTSLLDPNRKGRRRPVRLPGKTIFPIPSWAEPNVIVAVTGGETPDTIALLDVTRDRGPEPARGEPLAIPEVTPGEPEPDTGALVRPQAVPVDPAAPGGSLGRPVGGENPPIEARVTSILWKFGAGAGPAVTPSCPIYHAGSRRCVFVGAEPKGMALYSVVSGDAAPPKRLETGGLDHNLSDLAFSPDGRFVIFQTDQADRQATP